MTFRDFTDYTVDKRCYRCKQIMKDSYQGLINMGSYIHFTYECPMREFGHIQYCKHCGKDL